MVRAPLSRRAVRAPLARALAALAAGVFAGCGEGGSAAPGGFPPAVVEVVQASAGGFSDELELVGQLDAEESVLLRPEIAGVIQAIEFEEGQEVPAGQVLFVLRSDEQRAALREAQAELALANDVYRRTLALSKVEVSAQAELERARAQVDAAQAAVEQAQVDLDRTVIRAPFDGLLGARSVSPGDRVDPGSALVQIDAVERLRLRFSLPEASVGLARRGLAVQVEVAAFPGTRFPGDVYFVAPSLDPEARRLGLKAWVPNPDRRLRPGMFATLRLEIERSQAALLLPESAIAFDLSGPYVWRVAADSTAERVPVQLGPRSNGHVVIRQGIGPGDTIVSAGTHKLFPGGPLQAVAADAVVPDVAAGPEPELPAPGP